MIRSGGRFFTLVALVAMAAAARGQSNYYVDPVNGSDAANGSAATPWRTLYHARSAIDAINGNMNGDIHVNLAGGTHRLTSTLAFGPGDGGNNGFKVIYRAKAGEAPVISGGLAISGWSLYDAGNNIWSATAGQDIETRQLYVNGIRAIRARSTGGLPGHESVSVTDPSSPFRKPNGNVDIGHRTSWVAMAGWQNQSDIELVYKEDWTNPRVPVESIAMSGTKAQLTMRNPAFFWAKNKGGTSVSSPWYVENAYELLDQPGEFYLDRTTDTFYYIPRPGEDMATAEVVAPVLQTLIRVEGTDTSNTVNWLQFRDIAFHHTTWTGPNVDGFPDAQNAVTRRRFFVDGTFYDGQTFTYGDYPRYSEHIEDGAIVLKNAKSVYFEGNEFAHLGYIGLMTRDGVQNTHVVGNRFVDISATAIQIGDDYSRSDPQNFYPADPGLKQVNNDIRNNYIRDVAVEYRSGSGIAWVYPEDMEVLHNEIVDVPYAGMHGGWGWSYIGGNRSNETNGLSNSGPPPTRDLRVRYNRIENSMQVLRDGGAVYVLGETSGSPGRNFIEENFIKNAPNDFGALYLDEGSGFYDVTMNVIDVADKWLWIWNPSIEDVLASDNYTNSPEFRNDGTNTTVTGTVSFTGSSYPASAAAIVAAAGLEPAYEHLRDEADDLSFEAEALSFATNATADLIDQTDGASGDRWVRLLATGPGDWIEFTLPGIPAGAYELDIRHKTWTTRGISQTEFPLGADTGAALDMYAPAPSGYVSTRSGFLSVSAQGDQTVRFRVTGKNPASSGYQLSFDRFSLLPAAGYSFEAEDLVYTASGAPADVITQTDGAGNDRWVRLNADSVGDWIEFQLPGVAAGTYALALRWKQWTARGIAQTESPPGADFGSPIDMYGPAPSSYLTTVIGTKTYATTGTKTLRFRVVGKNVGSSEYDLSFDVISLTPQ